MVFLLKPIYLQLCLEFNILFCLLSYFIYNCLCLLVLLFKSSVFMEVVLPVFLVLNPYENSLYFKDCEFFVADEKLMLAIAQYGNIQTNQPRQKSKIYYQTSPDVPFFEEFVSEVIYLFLLIYYTEQNFLSVFFPKYLFIGILGDLYF